ncbi:endonuclease domain-containing protein [Marinomonas aquiplantarum]|uniref:Very-short-patch-repair endonuclease n=1 Tax=Marinomonas aquiplantarum TaxID=491951 RepID=A0A366D8Z9_9GAMM|nr:endonuclease domain-containing protein [Marinomonas aquiplantarum]RBO85758.1 very-short-patch-repair endonuclease [Marinomonas aquiplantarum]
MTKLFNLKRTKRFRADLRTNMTEPERRLWRHLRGCQFGVKFRRQYGIGCYVVDFYCPSLKLVIEIDGDSHFSTQGIAHDRIRDEYLSSMGISIIRFTNDEIMHELGSVVLAIDAQITLPPLTPP